MSEYGIGGNFLKTLQALYVDHNVYVRVTDGLLQPIKTTIGLKQGCGISPLLFNLFIDKITEIFDQSCDPVKLGGEDLSCLLWARSVPTHLQPACKTQLTKHTCFTIVLAYR